MKSYDNLTEIWKPAAFRESRRYIFTEIEISLMDYFYRFYTVLIRGCN